ncbi:MAG: YHS domain-containing protein, partial [Candidatus Sifarchaeia archaeon]
MGKDSVCGLEVDENVTKFYSDYMGKRYYFCTQSCKTRFDDSPYFYSQRRAVSMPRR